MIDLEVTIDPQMPGHAVYVTADGERVRVTVSPHVEASALAVFDMSIGAAVAEAVDQASDS